MVALRADQVTPKGLQAAVDTASADLARDGNLVETIQVPSGTYDLPATTADKHQPTRVIDISKIRPSGSGRLILSGAGEDKTTLVFYKDAVQFYGNGTRHLTIENLHLTTKQETVSQGTVVSVGTQPNPKTGAPIIMSNVVVAIDRGYPSPNDINENLGYGDWLRRYDDNNPQHTPELVDPDSDANKAVSWTCPQNGHQLPSCQPEAGHPDEFRLVTNQRESHVRNVGTSPAIYTPGEAVAIKAKSVGQAYTFQHTNDIEFNHILWTRKARGVFKDGTTNVKILNSAVLRDQPPTVGSTVPILSTSDGGPQLVQQSKTKSCFVATVD